MNIEKLQLTSQAKAQTVPLHFERYLAGKINWKNRLVGVTGARGSGKTTLLLQHLAKNLPKDGSALYVAMDDLFFQAAGMLELAENFSREGGKYLLLDEVHKYPQWSRELKLIYDNVPDLQVIFTSSSILEIYAGESDLSRRAVSYSLKELSLREYIELKKDIILPTWTLPQILENHVEIARTVNEKIKPIAEFQHYLQYGAYPYFIEGEAEYQQKLLQTINLIIDIDLAAVENLNYEMLVKVKKLLYIIATSVPFTPNISKLSKDSNISRPTLMRTLHLLEKARLIQQLRKHAHGIGILRKPEKLYLNNSNLQFALAGENTDRGTLRETFFMNQIQGIETIQWTSEADFLVDDRFIIEIGGKSKARGKLKNRKDAYIVKDDIEYGVAGIIPLWLFGFLY